ncbi:hypothetical protein D3C80_1992550 [compost metagenome]
MSEGRELGAVITPEQDAQIKTVINDGNLASVIFAAHPTDIHLRVGIGVVRQTARLTENQVRGIKRDDRSVRAVDLVTHHLFW